LGFDAGSVDEDARVGVETGEGTTDVGVQKGDFADCAGVLEF